MTIQWHKAPPRDGQIVVIAHASWRKEMQSEEIAAELEADHHCVGWMDHPDLLERPKVFGHKVKTAHRMVTGPAAMGMHRILQNKDSTLATKLLESLMAGEVPR